ncbi:MAG: heme exporter protein CcmD [Actinobacteria bacterium]|nr:heme exporter protein CcmD [Actinomycetota bacterium]
MSGYVVACYAVTIASLAGYAGWVVRRYLAVGRRVTPDESAS